VIVFVEDECHLLGGDTLGYGWGRRNERRAIPLKNVTQRQTSYGVMNLYHQAFTVTLYARGNGKNTVAFLTYLQRRHPDKKLILIWERARYHGGKEIQAYWRTVNQGLEEKDGKVTWLLFAPNAPDQNPVEDIWLQGKNFLRRHFYENKTVLRWFLWSRTQIGIM